MIGKIVKGGGFRGALNYDIEKEKGEVIETNMAGETPRELAAEFGEIRKLRPGLGRAVFHASLSAPPGEKLTNDQWREIGLKYLEGMGFTDNQFVITRHHDTDHEHIHIIANRISNQGEVISDSQDYKRQEELVRQFEVEYGLQRVAPSAESIRKEPRKGEIENQLRTGEVSIKAQLQGLADVAAKGCTSFTQYQERLEAVGVELVPVVQLEGAKLSGLSYRLDGVTMKGSDLGKGYTAAGTQKRGITYEQERDLAAVRRSQERESNRAFGQPDRGDQAGQAPERGGLGRESGAVGPGNGSPRGRDTADAGRDRPQEPAAGGQVQPADRGVSPGVERGGSRSPEGRSESQPGRGATGLEALRPDRGDRPAYGGARERLLALGEAADRGDNTRPASSGRAPETRDRSLEAIQRQVTALGVSRFDVGIRDAKSGKMMNREWSRDELAQGTAWLKRMNAKGNDVYIRPAGDHGLVMIDDVKPQALEKMRHNGHEPAATIETSPGNFQAWVKLSDEPLPVNTRTVAAALFARIYQGDLNSADGKHYGRLAGLTNQKPEHTRDGRQPYVLAHDSPGVVCADASRVLEKVAVVIDRHDTSLEQKARLEAIQKAQEANRRGDPVSEYRNQAQRLLKRYGPDADLSRIDWMAATELAKRGYPSALIAEGIAEGSPNIQTRKAGHIEEYAKRTAERAAADPDVVQHLQDAAKAAEKERQAQRVRRDRDGYDR